MVKKWALQLVNGRKAVAPYVAFSGAWVLLMIGNAAFNELAGIKQLFQFIAG